MTKLLNELKKDMSVAAILTGKGGSKLKDKNILMVDGKPCLYFPCMAAKRG